MKRSISLAGKAVALFCGGLLLVALLIGALEYRITREQVYNRMEDSAGNLLELLQNLVQEQPELLRDPAMGRILVRSGNRTAAVDRIMLLDGDGRLLAGSDSTLRPGSPVSRPRASQPGYNGEIYRIGGRRFLRLSEPFRPPLHRPGQAAAAGGPAGTIAIDIDLSAIDHRVALDFEETMAIAILALLCLTVVLMVLTRKYFVEPLVQLAEAADRFGQTGSAPKVTLSTGDELQLLAEAFNRTVESRQREEEMLRAARAAAETANRTKSDFLANMSHEIRTPMNGVMGMLDLALDTDLSPEQREYLEIAKSSADSLLTVINDILDFSKIEAGRLELDPIPFRLGDSIADMTGALAHRAHKKGLELAVEIAPDVPDTLVGDVGRLRQVLVNLIGNAIKFTDRGEVAVRIEASPGAGEAVLLHVAVADTGIGVPASKQAAIFQAFVQADTSTTRQYGGTGLGLPISSRLVELMGGRIWLESEPGRGSTFHFTALFQRADSDELTEIPEDARDLQGLTALVVDDNATNRRILAGILTGWGMAVELADGGPEGLRTLDLARAAGRPFQLLLLDALMPGVDGFQLVEEIGRQGYRDTATIIMLTSGGQRGDGARCRELGIRAYLTKPVRQLDLLRAIRLALAAPGGELITRHRLVQPEQPSPGPVRQLRILLAEDNPVNQQLVLRVLEKRGHRVTLTVNGREAVAAFERDGFDVILMDVQMPEMGGFEATAAIRSRENGHRTPIVAMTARAMKGDREECIAAGMDDYVSKPVSPRALVQVVETLAGRGNPEPAERTGDREKLIERFDGDQALLGQLAAIFLEDYPARLAALRAAVQRRDAGELEASAHALRGSVANFGARSAIDAALRLEEMGRTGDLTGVDAALKKFERGMVQLTDVLVALTRETSG